MQQYADIYSLHSDCAVNKCLHTVASSWTFLLTLNHDARNHELKKKLLLFLNGVKIFYSIVSLWLKLHSTSRGIFLLAHWTWNLGRS